MVVLSHRPGAASSDTGGPDGRHIPGIPGAMAGISRRSRAGGTPRRVCPGHLRGRQRQEPRRHRRPCGSRL